MRRDELPADIDEVWYVDCCPKDLTDPAGGLPFRVFDHHVSNQMLHGNDPRCTFVMDKSGTSLFAEIVGVGNLTSRFGLDAESILNGRKHVVQAIEDYDLGRFHEADGQFLADLAATFTQDEMLKCLLRDEEDVFYATVLSARADAVAQTRRIYAESAARSAYYSHSFRPPGWGDGFCSAGIAVSPVFWKNDVAEEILKKVELAIIIDPTGGMVSLRSKTLDCSTMATAMGGGGHARAAGFKANSHDILKSMMNEVLG